MYTVRETTRKPELGGAGHYLQRKAPAALALLIVSLLCLLVGCAEALTEQPAAETDTLVEKRAQARADVEDELTRLLTETRAQKNQFAEYQASTRTITLHELDMYPAKYWNLHLDNSSLRSTVSSIRDEYFDTHDYVLGESDLHEMVLDIWEMLKAEDITSYIILGNQSLEYESFQQCNYAWLLIFGRSSSFALDCETGSVRSRGWRGSSSSYSQYWEGYIYLYPSDLRADLPAH